MPSTQQEERFFLYLARGGLASVSYGPATELAHMQDESWIDTQLLPAVRILAKRRAKAIREVPIAFWLGVRSTARTPNGELFVFTTPFKAPRQLREAVTTALSALPQMRVAEGVEPICDGLIPCLQVYRGKILRFYERYEGHLYEPAVQWSEEAKAPVMCMHRLDPQLVVNQGDTPELWVRADCQEHMTFEQCQGWQMLLAKSVAMKERPHPSDDSQ